MLNCIYQEGVAFVEIGLVWSATTNLSWLASDGFVNIYSVEDFWAIRNLLFLSYHNNNIVPCGLVDSVISLWRSSSSAANIDDD